MPTIIQHLDAIEHLELVLPEFQREYVWKLDQAKQLLMSLYRDYPTGSLLFWETANPPDIKNNALPKNFIGRVRVLLDGQQRLTTLYLLIKGEIPPYYTAEDIINDPRELYFHMLKREFEYYGPVKMGNDPFWIRVVDFFQGKKPSIFKLAQEHAKDEDPMDLAQKLSDNLQTLEKIKDHDYPVQVVPSTADIDAAIDVFDLVNSQGTRLTEADLALAHMAGRWPDIRRVFKQKIEDLKRQLFPFKLDFLTRCITAIITQGALYERVHKTSRQDLEKAWATLSEVLDTVVGLLRGRAYVHSSEDLTTANVLVPIIVYLANNGGKFKNDWEIRRFLYWMYQAMLWARYSNRPDQMLDRDINHVLTASDPVKALLDDIIDARGRLDLRPADLEGRDARSPAFRIVHIVVKAQGAVDWFTGVPLAGNSSISNGETYYIFPHNVLWASGKFTSDNHIHVKMVNEIANRIFLEKWTASLQPPSEVLPKVLERNAEALVQQFVPSDPELWEVEHVEKFLALRREMIASGINSYLASLIDEKISPRVFPQIAKLPESVAAQARDGVEKLTIEEVDIGLFKLGRLFEGTLKDFIKAAETSGAYPVKPGNYEKLAFMIDWTKAQGIICDPTALHVLRQTRNDRAHEQAPSLGERQVLLNSAGWIAGMYLDYILFFAEQRQKLSVTA
jgi:hypothetical protein